MKQHVTDFPLGYDERTKVMLGSQNQIIITHPVMPPMVYDERISRWVEMVDNERASRWVKMAYDERASSWVEMVEEPRE